MTSGYPRPCVDMWNDCLDAVLLDGTCMETKRRRPVLHNCHLQCGRLTIKVEDGDEVVKILDENHKRKTDATSRDMMWRGGTFFYPLVDDVGMLIV